MARFLYWLVMLGSLSLLLCEPAQAAPSVRFLVLEGREMPFALIMTAPDGTPALVDGIIKDWQAALAGALGRTPVNVFYPRKRQELAISKGLADLRCFISPDWLPAALKSGYDWPQPIIRIEERLVSKQADAHIQTVDALKGKTIGTVLGYQFVLLDPLFASGTIRRDDSPSETGVIQKLILGRTDYAVIRTIDFDFLHKTDAQLSDLALSPLVISTLDLYCARPKNSHVSLAALNQAQQQLFKASTMEKILARYR
ncbi:substrate-binding periplasmic protein [Leeia oryzae]|uniref:substrate-binding periplasmic protein n=1 Tax=Leeia oryzae TaxID=356662 RepID=UPI00146164A7|nr:ABC transporter substrate-binding protein [Leeia oryzae]